MAISLIDRNAVYAALRLLSTTRLAQASDAVERVAAVEKMQAAQVAIYSRASEHAVDIRV